MSPEEVQLKKLLVINVLFTFLVSVMSMVVPLYLIYKKTNLEDIGIILAAMPLVFMVMRTFFASVADELGTRTIGAIYSASSVLSIALYTASNSVLGFCTASVFEGVRNSGFWAVIRTEIIAQTKEGEKGNTLAWFSGMRGIADGSGRFIAGVLIVYLAFQNTFLALGILSVVLMIIVLSLKSGEMKNLTINKKIIDRIFKKRDSGFWSYSIGNLLATIPSEMIGFMLIIYSSIYLRMGYEEIGILVTAVLLTSAVITLMAAKLKLSNRTQILFSFLMVPGLILIPLSGTDLFIPLLLFAIGNGFNESLQEILIIIPSSKSADISTDIGILNAPLRIGEFFFYCLSGFAVVIFGPGALFFGTGIMMLAFVFWAYACMKNVTV